MPGRKHTYCIYLSEKDYSDFKRLSQSYMKPHAEVVRARILLLSFEHPEWTIQQLANETSCTSTTVTKFRHRWIVEGNIKNHPRSGAPRKYPATVRTQITALACSPATDHDKTQKRWTCEKLAQAAKKNNICANISPSTINRWLQEDKIKPWQYHLWQKSTDPNFVEKAAPVLDLYKNAAQLAQKDELAVCIDEKTSIQARKPLHDTKPAIAGKPVQIASRYERMGSLQLFCALIVHSGITYARTYARKRFSEFKSFLLGLFFSTAFNELKVLDLILDNGSTHAPKQLASWISSLNLSFDVQIFWLPKNASWLDQVEIIFSKVTRDVLTPNDFCSIGQLSKTLMQYFQKLNINPKPIEWNYTKIKLLAKFAPDQIQLAA